MDFHIYDVHVRYHYENNKLYVRINNYRFAGYECKLGKLKLYENHSGLTKLFEGKGICFNVIYSILNLIKRITC